MNDYLAKPVDPLRLHAMLAFWHPADTPSPSGTATDGKGPADTADMEAGGNGDVLDVSSLGRLVHHDPSRLRNLIDTYVASTREHMNGLQQAMAAQDMAQQAFWAHKIKGSAPWIGAHGLARQCERLQHCANQSDQQSQVTALAEDVLARCEAILVYLLREISSH